MDKLHEIEISITLDSKYDDAGWRYAKTEVTAEYYPEADQAHLRINAKTKQTKNTTAYVEEIINVHFNTRSSLNKLIEQLEHANEAWRSVELATEFQFITPEFLNSVSGRPTWLVEWHLDSVVNSEECLTTYVFDDTADSLLLKIWKGNVVMQCHERDDDSEYTERVEALREYRTHIRDMITAAARHYRKKRRKSKKS